MIMQPLLNNESESYIVFFSALPLLFSSVFLQCFSPVLFPSAFLQCFSPVLFSNVFLWCCFTFTDLHTLPTASGAELGAIQEP